MREKNLGQYNDNNIEIEFENIANYCNKRNMKAYLSSGLLFINTPFGDWYIKVVNRRISLFHKNSTAFNLKNGRKNLAAQYHNQNKEFDNIYDMLEYIYIHDFKKIDRELALYSI